MDRVDKRILFELFKDGRVSQRRISGLVKMSPPVVSYRVKKMRDSGILKGFSLYVNPNFAGLYRAYAAFKNRKDYSDNVSLKFYCLEEVNVYEIYGRNLEEIMERFKLMTQELGEPVMKYVPAQIPYRRSKFDEAIVSYLVSSPEKRAYEIAEMMKISAKTVNRHIRYLIHKSLIRVFPVIDLTKSDIVFFSIFSEKVNELEGILSPFMVWEIRDSRAGIFNCIAENLEKAKKIIDAAREKDKEAGVMLVYGYIINNEFIKQIPG